MADEKLNTGQEENPQPSLFDNGPEGAPAQDAPTPEPPTPENVPEQAAGDAPAQDAPAGAPGEVNVSADQIEKLMAERRAAERAEVEKNEPPEPEQPPTPAPEEKAAEKKGPAKEGKTTGEKAPEPEKPKGRRGRKPKEEKAGPGEPGGTGARRGRPAKADKAATDKPPSPPRDKMSQGKGGKAATVKGKEEAPAAPQPAPEVPPQPRDATRAEKEEIVYLNLSELFPFKDHPFGVRDDAEMKGLVESVKDNGVHQPALVRPREGGGYEIIAGHRRQRASELAGFGNMPCIIRNMTDDEAILAMTDDNLRHREKILPTEKAQSLKMQVEAIKHQGARPGEDAQEAGKRSTQIVGDRNGMNYKQVQRYIRLTELVPDLQKMLDEKKLAFTPAVEISFIRPKHQKYIAVSIEGQQSSPSLSQAQRLRKLDQEGKLNGDVIDGILSEPKKEVDKVIINSAELEKYFGKDKTPREMKDTILALLDEWKEKQPPELGKPEKKADKFL